MSGYKPKLTQKILKIIKNSNIIDPTLITTLGDLKKINTTFFVFIHHLIEYYHNNIHIFDYPKDKTFDSLLNENTLIREVRLGCTSTTLCNRASSLTNTYFTDASFKIKVSSVALVVG